MRKRGLFITLEGTDGVGKSTQGHLLADWLRKEGYEVVETREPGGGAAAHVGERIRALLLDPLAQMASLTELLLYEAARAEHVDKVVRPALESRKIVVCDRYTDSTVAYQGAARGLSVRTIEQLNRIATSGLQPDLTLLLDLPPAEGLSKALKRTGQGDRLENEGEAFLNRVRRGFLAVARRDRRRVKLVRVRETIEETRKAIQKLVEPHLS